VICLTSDVHHASLGTGNQRASALSEVQVARRYLALLADAGVKATFFVSGRAFLEEWAELEPLCAHPLVEIGGHNFNCFKLAAPHRLWKKIAGSYNGPAWIQRRDALRTIRIIEERTGRRPILWRNHMYMHGPHTERVLAACGIRLCSDGVRARGTGPEWHRAGLYNFPLNVIPDHEHIYHAERTPAWVERWVRRYHWSDDFGPGSYPVEQWTDIVLDNLRRNEERGAVSNMLIHPITLHLADGFKSFARILDFLARHETVHMSEVLASPAGGRARAQAHA